MAMKDCNFCRKNKVPENGQCNSCGFIDGLNRQPVDEEFKAARQINEEHDYEQFSNLDMMLLDIE
ncbi:hypothetical protein ACFL0W_03555 [Nanoarchaeota archaeon]